MIEMKSGAVSADLTKQEAKALTDRIRDSIEKTYELVLRAYERKAWKALGYKTWEAYVQTEFDMSRRRSYQLLDQGRVIRAIEEAVGENVQHVAQITAREVAAVKDDIPAVVEEAKARADEGEDPALVVKEIAAERLAEKSKSKSDAAPVTGNASAQDRPARPKAESKAAQTLYNGLPAEDRIAELEAEVAALEGDNATLTARLKTYQHLDLMYRDWTEGGWDKVVGAKEETIAELQRTAQSRIARESEEKVRNLNAMRGLARKLESEGKGRDIYIDLDEVSNG